MVKFFEGLPLFPSATVLVASGSALSYCARAHAQGEAGVDVENLITYQSALWQHAKRDEQLRTLGGLLARILR